MTRRSGDRRQGRGVAPKRSTTNQAFDALIQGAGAARDFWFDANSVAIDGGSGNTQSWVDNYDPTHTLTVPGAVRCPAPAVNANFANAKTITFSGVESYVSSRALANWAFAHQGSSTLYLVWRPTSDAVAIMFGTSGNPEALGDGIDTWRTGGAAQAQTRATGIDSTFIPGLTVNVATYISISLGAGAWEIKRKGTSVASNTGETFGAAAAQYAMTLGRLGTGLVGDVHAFGGFHRVLTAKEQAVVQRKILATTGILP